MGPPASAPIERSAVLKNLPGHLLFWLLLLILGPSSAQGQLNLVGGVAHTQDLGGQWGADLRLGLDPPGIPIGFFGGADYFPASCEKSCSLWGYRVGAIMHSSTPAVQPYLTGGYVVRERKHDAIAGQHVGLAVGAGLRTTKGIRVQAEATWEFLGDAVRHWVIRVGLGL
jgi:hypothetical protein